jgi:hypothetical protein
MRERTNAPRQPRTSRVARRASLVAHLRSHRGAVRAVIICGSEEQAVREFPEARRADALPAERRAQSPSGVARIDRHSEI